MRSFDADRGAVVDCRATPVISVVDVFMGDGWCSFTVRAHDVAALESQSSAEVSVNVREDGCPLLMPIAFVALARVPHVRGDRAVGADGCSSIIVQGTSCCYSFPGYRSCAVVVDGCCSFNVGADGALVRCRSRAAVVVAAVSVNVGVDGCCSFSVGADDVAVLESQSSTVGSFNVGEDGLLLVIVEIHRTSMYSF